MSTFFNAGTSLGEYQSFGGVSSEDYGVGGVGVNWIWDAIPVWDLGE
jgi:hypothetical protein